MATYLEQVQQSKYIYFGFDSTAETPSDIWKALPCICLSDDALNWRLLCYLPKVGSLRDGFMRKIGDWYYMIGTLGFYKTKDFLGFTNISLSGSVANNNYSYIWAPELFQDVGGNWHIIWFAIKNSDGSRGIYLADFDPSTDTISNAYTLIQGLDVSKNIDPSMFYYDGKYYLFLGGQNNIRLLQSDKYNSGFTDIDTNLDSNVYHEGPDTLIAENTIYLYSDRSDGTGNSYDNEYLTVRKASLDDLSTWTIEQKLNSDVKMRHGSFIYNSDYQDYASTQTDENDILLEQDYLNRETYLQRQHNWEFIRKHFPAMYSKMFIELLNQSTELSRYVSNVSNINEVIDARTDSSGKTFDTLEDRLNSRAGFSMLEVTV